MQERIIFILIRFTIGRLVQQFVIPTGSRFDFTAAYADAVARIEKLVAQLALPLPTRHQPP
jgi:hypothetical protein